jgi:CarD family transcriptional regulator
MKQVKTKIESGDPIQVGEVIRDLYPKYSENSLSSSDQRIFEKCRDLVVSEMALIREVGYEEATDYFERTLANGHRKHKPKNGKKKKSSKSS